MDVRGALSGAQTRVSAALAQAKIAVRVASRTGMLANVSFAGARVLLRELPRGKANPSLLFRLYAASSPHRIALICPNSLSPHGSGASAQDRAYSFFELNDIIDRVGHGLHRRGIGPGKSVLVMLKNRAEFLMLQSAVGRIGAAGVTVSWRSTAPELAYLAQHSESSVLFFDADLADLVRGALPGLGGIKPENAISVGGSAPGFPSFDELIAEPGVAPDQSELAAVVMYTSGTTGKPKGAVRKFANGSIGSTFAAIGETPMRVGDVHLAVCPLYHLTAFGFVGFTYVLGSTVVVLPEFRPELFLEAIQRYRVTTTAVVPTMLHRVLELGEERLRAYDTSSLRAIFSAGAPLPAALAAEVMNVFGPKLYNFYGATETGLVTVAGPEDLRASPGTIGRAIAGTEILLVRDDKRPCAEGEVGELYARSSLLVSGYHNDPDATRDSMLEGYFSVGDLARRDARGCYHIEGRKRDMIISGGVNVYPAEVEGVLHDHPAIGEAAVVGIPDRAWGERVRAFVVLRFGATASEEEIQAFCRARLAGPKVPRDIVFLDALPRNPTGKVLKRELVAMEV